VGNKGNSMLIARYTGDWKKLKALGFMFQRLFASNYICYHTDEIWLWRKDNRFEIQDLYGRSGEYVKYLVDRGWEFPGRFKIALWDEQEKKVVDNFSEFEIEGASELLEAHKMAEYAELVAEKFHKRYRRVGIKDETLALIKSFYEAGEISLTEEV
jgi:hypothetical protein